MGDEVEDTEARGGKLGWEKGTVRYIHDVQEHAVAHTTQNDEKWDPRYLHEKEKIEACAKCSGQKRAND